MSRVFNIEINERFSRQTWRPIDFTSAYIVLVNSHIAVGGHGYQTLGDVPPDKVTDTGITDATEAFVNYAMDQKILQNPHPEEYSTQGFTPPPGE